MSESMYSELQQTYTQMQADHDIKLQENAITLQEMNKVHFKPLVLTSISVY